MTLTETREKIAEEKELNELIWNIAAERGDTREDYAYMTLGKISAYEKVLQLLDQFIEEIPWNNP